MNAFSFTVLAIAVVACAQDVDVSTTGRLSTDKSEDLRSRVAMREGCNLNFCFVLGGDSSITQSDLSRHVGFIITTMPIINLTHTVNVATAQYGTPILEDQPLTYYFHAVVDKFMRPPRIPPRRATSMVSRMSYCSSQLPTRRSNTVNMMVVFGGGDAVIGAGDISYADYFRRTGGEVCVVGDGITNNRELLAIAGRDSNRVLNLNSNYYPEFQRIVDDLVADTC